MATNNKQSLRDELASYNHDLEICLKERVGMSLKTFKTLKATTQLIGTGAGIYAISQGAPPFATYILIATIVSGPEVLEYFLEQQGGGDNS